MKVRITPQIQNIISSISQNTDRQKSALKIYAGLYLRNHRQNKLGYFEMPSTHLMSLNRRYKEIMEHFEKNGLIAVRKRAHDVGGETKLKKYYDTSRGICMSYKFLLETDGDEIFVDMESEQHKHKEWYNKLYNSLIQIQDENEIWITRDDFGRRVHHSLIKTYKKVFQSYYTIDAVASHPHILNSELLEFKVKDKNWNKVFSNDDFYTSLQEALKVDTRKKAKELFNYWLNGDNTTHVSPLSTIFPKATEYINQYKKSDYRGYGKRLQRLESEMWIDDILTNIPIDFAIPIHDSIVVIPSDLATAYEWITCRYSNMKFKWEEIE